MASTFEHIQTITIGSNVNVVEFANIDTSLYESLQIIGNLAFHTSQPYVEARFNSDTTAKYGMSMIYRNGSTMSSLYQLSETDTFAYTGEINGGNASNNASAVYLTIHNSNNTSLYKNWLSRTSSDNYNMQANGWWKSTSAISNIKISARFSDAAQYFTPGSKLTLIGIRSA